MALGPMHHDGDTAPHAPLTCGAATRNGGRCKNPPMHGGTRCRMHGGAAPQTRALAAARTQQAEALAALEASGYQPVTDPVTALQDVAGRQHLVTLAVQHTLTRAAQRDGLETVAGQPIAQWLQKALTDESRTLSKMIEIGLPQQQRARLTADAAQLVEWLTTAFQAGQANPDADPQQAINEMIGDPNDP